MSTLYDDKFEFDAPRYVDFTNGSPPDAEGLDSWFEDESATRRKLIIQISTIYIISPLLLLKCSHLYDIFDGDVNPAVLATPDEVINRSREASAPKKDEHFEVFDLKNLEITFDHQGKNDAPSKQQTDTRRGSLFGSAALQVKAEAAEAPSKAEEAAHVRAVLAHITNNMAGVPESAKRVTRSTSKAACALRGADIAGRFGGETAGGLVQSNMMEDNASCENRPGQMKTSTARLLTRSAAKSAANTIEVHPAADPSSHEWREMPSNRSEHSSVCGASFDKRSTRKQKSTDGNIVRDSRRRKITVPKSPLLRSKQRSAVQRHHVKSSEELELEEIERAKRQAAELRRRNQQRSCNFTTNSGNETVRPPAQPAKRRALTAPKSPMLRTSKRQRVHEMTTRSMEPKSYHGNSTAQPEWKSTAKKIASCSNREFTMGRKTIHGKDEGSAMQSQRSSNASRRPAQRNPAQRKPRITLPRTPQFATASRTRPPRFKSTEEEELEKVKREKRQLQKKSGQSDAHSNQRINDKPASRALSNNRSSKRKQLTEPKPFSFATDARAAHRVRPVPQHTPPFVFGQDKGPVTRHRARMIATVVERSENGHTLASAAPDANSADGPVEEKVSADQRDRNTEEPVQATSKSSSFGVLRTSSWLRGGAKRVLTSSNDTQSDQYTVAEKELKDMMGERRQHDSLASAGRAEEAVHAVEEDGMQEAIRHGATLHNPLFRA